MDEDVLCLTLAEYDECVCCRVDALGDGPVDRDRCDQPCNPRGCAMLHNEDGLMAAYEAHYSTLLRRARQVVVDPDLAEEAVQEAFVRAWRNCAQFDPGQGRVISWLVVITRNVAVDLVKARARRPPVVSGESGADRHDPSASLSDVDRLLLREELGGALATIGPEHRRAVVETILRDRPYADVAAELGVPAATLRTRVHYALRKLRALLADPA